MPSIVRLTHPPCQLQVPPRQSAFTTTDNVSNEWLLNPLPQQLLAIAWTVEDQSQHLVHQLAAT